MAKRQQEPRRFEPAWAYPPGEFIREELAERGMSEDDFARIIGWTRETLDALLVRNEPIDAQQAADIAKGFGTSAQFWLNLEMIYRRWLGYVSFDGRPGWDVGQYGPKRRAARPTRGEGTDGPTAG